MGPSQYTYKYTVILTVNTLLNHIRNSHNNMPHILENYHMGDKGKLLNMQEWAGMSNFPP